MVKFLYNVLHRKSLYAKAVNLSHAKKIKNILVEGGLKDIKIKKIDLRKFVL